MRIFINVHHRLCLAAPTLLCVQRISYQASVLDIPSESPVLGVPHFVFFSAPTRHVFIRIAEYCGSYPDRFETFQKQICSEDASKGLSGMSSIYHAMICAMLRTDLEFTIWLITFMVRTAMTDAGSEVGGSRQQMSAHLAVCAPGCTRQPASCVGDII